MPVSLNIVLDVLEKYQTESHVPSGQNPSFRLCLPLADTASPLLNNCLYFGPLSAALKTDRRNTDAVIICERDRTADGTESSEALTNLVIINQELPEGQLAKEILERFCSVMDWENRLNEALLSNCSMQDLVDLCPPFLINQIQITDASFMKLAQSSQIDCDCPICVALKKYGYHPEETVEKFRKYNLFDVWARMDQIYYDPETSVAKYPTIHKIFKYHGSYYAHVVMSCNNEPPRPALFDLFEIFIHALSVCVERDWETKKACVHPYDAVFQDLLEDTIRDRKELMNRAERTDLPMEGLFYLIQIVPPKEQTAPFGTVLKEFSERYPLFRFINYNDTIVAFIHKGPDDHIDLKEYIRSLDTFLKKHDSYCGVSSCFTNLIHMHTHFLQAQLALKFARFIHNSNSPIRLSKSVFNFDRRICPFDAYAPFSFLTNDTESRKVWEYSNAYRLLYRLYENDLQRNTDDLRLLYVYLTHERKSTEVAAILNMHRNSIIYRINRIEEFLQIDLNDEFTRYSLLLAYLPVIAYGFQKQ